MINTPISQAPPPGGYSRVLSNTFATSYSTQDDVWTDEPAMAQPVNVLLRRLTSPQAHILDVGAGRGRDAKLVLEAGHRVTAVDVVRPPDWDEILRDWPNSTLLVGDVVDLTVCERFDAILDNGCFHHQHPSRHAAYLARLHDLLLPTGSLLLTLFTPRHERTHEPLWVQDDGRLTRDFTGGEAAEALVAAGFDVVLLQRIPRDAGLHDYLLVIAEPAGANAECI